MLLNNSKKVNDFLNYYYEYIDLLYNKELEIYETYIRLLNIYSFFKNNNVPCEIILFGNEPISQFFDAKLVFLGIDIINKNYESLLTHPNIESCVNFLNDNGLLDDVLDVKKTKDIMSSFLSGFQWNPCYIYKVLETGDATLQVTNV